MGRLRLVDRFTDCEDMISPGEFVKIKGLTDNFYGLIMPVYGPDLTLKFFHSGFEQVLHMALYSDHVTKATKKEAKDFFEKASDKFRIRVVLNGLEGALAARKQYCVDNIIEQIEKTKGHYLDANQAMPSPKSGVYVVMGDYWFDGVSEAHLQGLCIHPWTSEMTMGNILREWYPNGFGNIPAVLKQENQKPKELKGYVVAEVPRDAVQLVEKPISLRAERIDKGFKP